MPELGDVLPFATTVRDSTGALANVGSMTLTITRDGVAEPGSPFTISPTTTGQYDKDYAATAAGTYVGYWVGTGTNAAAYSQTFDVQPADPRYLVSLARMKSHLNMPASSTTNDEELRTWLAATTPIVERYVGPVLVRTITGERQEGVNALWLRNFPVLTDVAGLAAFTLVPWLSSGTTYAVSTLKVNTTGRVERKDGLPFTGGPFSATYQVGRRIIPPNISAAALIVCAGLWETQRGASALPRAGADELIEAPGMGLVMWRARQLLEADEIMGHIA